MKLSPPPSKTPLFDDGFNTLNHVWQRWLSDLYLSQKEGNKGPTGSEGQQGQTGRNGVPGSDGTDGQNIEILADGGFAYSVYLPSQKIDGGNANG